MQIYKIHTISQNYFQKIKFQFSPDTIPASLLSSPSHTPAPYLLRIFFALKEERRNGANTEQVGGKTVVGLANGIRGNRRIFRTFLHLEQEQIVLNLEIQTLGDSRELLIIKGRSNNYNNHNIVAICFSTAALIKALMDIPACLARKAMRLCVSGEIRILSEPE